MNYKILGIIAIVFSPFLYIDFLTSAQNKLQWTTGLFDFLYMLGWICSIFAIHKMNMLGKSKFAKFVIIVQFSLLTLAQGWNIWVMLGPSVNNPLFRLLDMCWPLSNIWMLIIGVTAITSGRLQGWKRFVPLVAGLWFPLMVVPALTLGIMTSVAGPYSAIAFALLGFMVYKATDDQRSVAVEAVNID